MVCAKWTYTRMVYTAIYRSMYKQIKSYRFLETNFSCKKFIAVVNFSRYLRRDINSMELIDMGVNMFWSYEYVCVRARVNVSYNVFNGKTCLHVGHSDNIQGNSIKKKKKNFTLNPAGLEFPMESSCFLSVFWRYLCWNIKISNASFPIKTS